MFNLILSVNYISEQQQHIHTYDVSLYSERVLLIILINHHLSKLRKRMDTPFSTDTGIVPYKRHEILVVMIVKKKIKLY